DRVGRRVRLQQMRLQRHRALGPAIGVLERRLLLKDDQIGGALVFFLHGRGAHPLSSDGGLPRRSRASTPNLASFSARVWAVQSFSTCGRAAPSSPRMRSWSAVRLVISTWMPLGSYM